MAAELQNHEALLSPKTHGRSESYNSHNYSFLDFYDVETANEMTSICENNSGVTASHVLLLPVRISADDTPNHTLTSVRNSKASANLAESRAGPRSKQILTSDTDLYGFHKNSLLFASTLASYNKWFKRYLLHVLAQKRKWELQMKSNGLSSQLHAPCPDSFPPKSDKIKKLVRRGIPPEWRGSAWFFYAGGNERLNKNVGVYHKIVTDTEGTHNKDTEVIERDLHRTFPDNIHFKASGLLEPKTGGEPPETAMISSLRRVLTAFAHYQPQIGYCQSLNFISGLLLLFMSEEHAFWMLVIMTERIIPKVHSADLEGVHTDQGVLMMCIKEYIPKLWAIIGRNYDGSILKEDKILTRLPPLTLVTSSWFMSVFIGVLPIESVLRIWDIIWYEGSKTIFRVSLTLCRLCFDDPSFQLSRDAKGPDSNFEAEQIELFQFMQNYPKQITDPSMLIDLCFKKIGGYGYGFLSQNEINKCREFVAYQRNKLQTKKAVLGAEMSESERDALAGSGTMAEESIHDVYGFNKSIMSGVAWNRHMSGMMKKKFAKKGKYE
ncbi:RabGAP/TBC [Metschnikowia bicuspidata var. bicuspidata NRRL YB-4993]|uniref:RabGAP/TBC n=1 Tax=Metschnikowia bicuspidata var. bicuspidata NRRL YB-4993 TaxID=869754 RepID=A0A1A0HCK6_9ASCO|nr:RabGAP/TBC [Metschnikowia bicuspidata var. bicuspidata NRRL YB-4993]OBA21839.1 RabGAP/TBC [Metschnikowia bicuspidata var. bicuspidata NRRL YB-4993]